MKLTERELWLMRQAYNVGRNYPYDETGPSFGRWLAESVDDQGHSVEMLLTHDAPAPVPVTKEEGDIPDPPKGRVIAEVDGWAITEVVERSRDGIAGFFVGVGPCRRHYRQNPVTVTVREREDG